MRLTTCLPALAIALLWAALPTFAADPPTPKAVNKASTKAVVAPPKNPVMTREELRDCMARQERVRSRSDAVVKTKSDLDAQKAEVTRQDAALKEELATLDRTSADAVNGYNAKVQARDKLIDDYNARSPAFNADVEALQAERTAYSKSCENRRFDEKDEAAIKSGK